MWVLYFICTAHSFHIQYNYFLCYPRFRWICERMVTDTTKQRKLFLRVVMLSQILVFDKNRPLLLILYFTKVIYVKGGGWDGLVHAFCLSFKYTVHIPVHAFMNYQFVHCFRSE